MHAYEIISERAKGEQRQTATVARIQEAIADAMTPSARDLLVYWQLRWSLAMAQNVFVNISHCTHAANAIQITIIIAACEQRHMIYREYI